MRLTKHPYVLLVIAALAATSCSGPASPINAALRQFPQSVRIGDLSQTSGVPVVPLAPTVPTLAGVLNPVPLTPLTIPVSFQGPKFTFHVPVGCPLPPNGASPAQSVGSSVTGVPAPGRYYPFRASGRHTMGGANAGLVNYPTDELRAVGPPSITTVGAATIVSYPVYAKIGDSVTRTIYQVLPLTNNYPVTGYPTPGLYISAVQTLDSTLQKVTSSFTPQPPMLEMPFPASPGATFNVASVDPSTGDAVAYSGTVGKEVQVNACGQLVDTREVTETGTISVGTCGAAACNAAEQSPAATSNFTATYDVALQYGGLSVRDHVTVQGLGNSAPYSDDLTATINQLPAAALK